MQESLKQRTFKGFLWNGIENVAVQALNFIIGIILARKLIPADYGMVGMLAIFIAISQTLINCGFSNALIRTSDRTEKDFSTAFYFNIVVGILLYWILYATAPLIAGFYEMPELAGLVKIVSIPLILNSLCIVQQSILSINIDFKTQSGITIVSTLCSGITGISLAYRDFGAYSLAISSAVYSFVRCVLLWTTTRWKPILSFSWHSFKRLFSFGSKLLMSGLIDTAYNNIYPLIIGKSYSSVDLGYYSRAYGYSSLPSTTITGLISRVTYPVLCTIQHDDRQLETIYRKMIRFTGFIVFPVMLTIVALARPLIVTLITAKWEPCIGMLQILCFAFVWYPIHALNLNLLQVKGRSDLFLRLEIIKKIIGISVLLITMKMGIAAMCFGLVGLSLITLIINTYYTGILIDVGLSKQIKDLLPAFFISAVAGCAVFVMNAFVGSGAAQLILGFAVSAVLYLGLSYCFNRNDLAELLSLVKSNILKK